MASPESPQQTNPPARITFEQALAQLEQIVEQIESGQVSLEDSIERYAQGVALIKQCRSILDTAEQRIQLLTQGDDGKLKVEGELPDLDEPTEKTTDAS